MKTEFTNEMPENGKAALSADALVEEAKNGKLTDDELDKVAGGIQSISIAMNPKTSTVGGRTMSGVVHIVVKVAIMPFLLMLMIVKINGYKSIYSRFIPKSTANI